MNFIRTPKEQAVKSLNRVFMIAVGLCILLASVQVLPSLFIRQTEIVTITGIDAARECRSRRAYKIWPEFRSSIPRHRGDYCGLIMSDHGSFELPQTTWISLFRTPREALYDGLATGCKFRIVVVGPGFELEKGQGMTNRNRTLVRAESLGGCDILDET